MLKQINLALIITYEESRVDVNRVLDLTLIA